MLRHPNGEYFLPLVDGENEVVQFEDEESAELAANGSSLGSEVGYEIFDFREGE
jgi:hypothetical protein